MLRGRDFLAILTLALATAPAAFDWRNATSWYAIRLMPIIDDGCPCWSLAGQP